MFILTDLNKIVENTKAFWIITALYINKRSNLWSSERYMLIPHNNLKLLAPNTVRFWPVVIIFLHYLNNTKQNKSKHNLRQQCKFSIHKKPEKRTKRTKRSKEPIVPQLIKNSEKNTWVKIFTILQKSCLFTDVLAILAVPISQKSQNIYFTNHSFSF